MWVPADPAAADLVERTVARLRAEAQGSPQLVKVEFRQRLAALAGLAAAVLIILALGQLASVEQGVIRMDPAWAVGLELEPVYDTQQGEIEGRLREVQAMLTALDEQERHRLDPVEELRTDLERLGVELERF